MKEGEWNAIPMQSKEAGTLRMFPSETVQRRGINGAWLCAAT